MRCRVFATRNHMASDGAVSRVELITGGCMSGVEISEEQAAGIVAAAGLEPVDGCGALSGWRLGELNSRI